MESTIAQTLQADSRQLEKLDKSFQSDATEISKDNNIFAEKFIENQAVWMTSAEAARYLRKSVGALRVMVCRRQIRARKFHRRLYFKRLELDRLLDSSEIKGGI